MMLKGLVPFRAAAALVVGLAFATVSHAGPYNQIYGFGDSLSDTGNDLIITGGAVPIASIYTDGAGTTGRFTNGHTYLDVLANSLGLSLTPSVIPGGNNYAFGGARTNYVNPGLPATAMSFNQQISSYTALGSADPNALYVLWIGANDMSDAIQAAAGGNAGAVGGAIGVAMNGIGTALTKLAALGAKHFLVPNLPDLSLVPAFAGIGSPQLSALAHGVTLAFNQNLANTLGLFGGALDIRNLNVFAALNDIVADPTGFGFTNVQDACYTGEVDGNKRVPTDPAPTVCANPNQYAFFDYEHPTAAIHAELGARAFSAVIPEPPLIWLLVFAMGGLTTWARRRRAAA